MASQANIEKRRIRLKQLLLDGIGIPNCAELLEVHPDTLSKDFRDMRDELVSELDWVGRLLPKQLVSRARTMKLNTLIVLGYNLTRIAKLLGVCVGHCYAMKKYECSGDAKIRIKITSPILAVDGETDIPAGDYEAMRVGNANVALSNESRTYIAHGKDVADNHKLLDVYRN